MDWKNPFRKGPKALDGPAGVTEDSDASPLGDAIVANEAVKKKQMLPERSLKRSLNLLSLRISQHQNFLSLLWIIAHM